MSTISNGLLLLVEAFGLGALLCLLVQLRRWLGITPIAIFIGTLQYLQVALAISLYVALPFGISASPGSAALFPATLLGILLIYIVEDAVGARAAIYGLLVANTALSILTTVLSLHLGDSNPGEAALPIELLRQNPRVMIVGTVTLFLDTMLIIVVFEWLGRVRMLGLRVWISFAVVLTIDTVVFVTGSFVEDERYGGMLFAGIATKLACSVPYAMAVAMFRRVLRPAEPEALADVFHVLTYRERYEQVKEEARVDGLTGLRNRRALDDELPVLLRARAAVLLIDVDHFKRINDDLGHAIGDEVLRRLGALLKEGLRPQDRAYRYGGEELAIVLPEADAETAHAVGERLLSRVRQAFREDPLPDSRDVSATIGVASSPADGDGPSSVLEAADRRLYRGKTAGRARVEQPHEASGQLPPSPSR